MVKKAKRCKDCQFLPCRCEDLEAGYMGASCHKAAWRDFTSKALQVHPSQVAEANARNKRHGVNVVYDRTGLPHIPDRAARKSLLKLEGAHDDSAGYGD